MFRESESLRFRHTERSHSGLVRAPAKGLSVMLRGFKSLSFRHNWNVLLVVYGARLESVCIERCQEFESLTFRHPVLAKLVIAGA